MNKKKAIKLVTATAIAASAITAVAPAQSEAAASLTSQIKSAKAKMKKPYDRYIKATKLASINTVQKEITVAKKAQKDINAKIKKAKLKTKDKNKKLAEVKAYNKYITYAEGYVKAYKEATAARTNLNKLLVELEKTVATQDVTATLEQYAELQVAIKEAKKDIKNTVYGAKIEALLFNKFTKPTETLLEGGVQKAIDAYKYEETKKAEAAKVNDYAKLADGDLSTQDLIDAAKEAKAAIKLDQLKVADQSALNDKIVEADKKVEAAEEALKVPAVKEIKAINAKTIEVTFNTALAEGTTEAQLLAAFSLEGKVDSAATLSEDRKTATFTVNSAEVSNVRVSVSALDTDQKDANNAVVKTKEYNSLFSYNDVVDPEVAKTEFTYTDTGADAKLIFSEALSARGTISVNGTVVTPKSSSLAAGEVVLGDLEVGKKYTIDIVGATDTAVPTGNKADHIKLSFTVPAEEVDTTVPTVTTSTNGNKLSLTFSEEVTEGTVSIGGVNVQAADVTTTDNKTYVVDVQKANSGAFFTNNANFFTAEVVVKGFKDQAKTPNAMKEVKFNSTFTADKTAASLVNASATAEGKVVLEFNEDVVSPASISSLVVKSIDGIMQTGKTLTVKTAQHPVVNGKAVTNQLELTLDAGTQLVAGKTYSIELAKDSVEDIYSNKIANVINFNVVRPATSQTAGKVITTTISETANVIDIAFAGTDAAGMTDSVLSTSNYTIGGKALPSNTDIKFINNKNNVRITLPEGFVTANGAYTFTASNLTDQFGNTLVDGENTAQLDLTENVAPTVNTALTVNGSNEVVVSFSESVESKDLDADTKLFEGISVKVNGTVAAITPTVANGKLKVTLTNAVSVSDNITVDFNNAELTDANGNQVKNGVASN